MDKEKKMKYAIDRIIESVAILENIEDGTKIEVSINLLPTAIHDGSIIAYKDGLYLLDETEEERRRHLISEKFNRLKNNN